MSSIQVLSKGKNRVKIFNELRGFKLHWISLEAKLYPIFVETFFSLLRRVSKSLGNKENRAAILTVFFALFVWINPCCLISSSMADPVILQGKEI